MSWKIREMVTYGSRPSWPLISTNHDPHQKIQGHLEQEEPAKGWGRQGCRQWGLSKGDAHPNPKAHAVPSRGGSCYPTARPFCHREVNPGGAGRTLKW